jgi:Tc toxin complex TcA C-terminal TcB-binding domain/Neuraminidase-like domain
LERCGEYAGIDEQRIRSLFPVTVITLRTDLKSDSHWESEDFTMTPINAPIKVGDTGTQVANLQDALLALLATPGGKIIQALDSPNRPTPEELKILKVGLEQERAQSLFGKATRQLIVYFQVQQGLGDNLDGTVEEKTAAKLNEILTSLGLVDQSTLFRVHGTVTTADNKPISGASVSAFDRDLRKEQPLGDAKTRELGDYAIPYGPGKFQSGDVPSAPVPKLIVRAYDLEGCQIGNDIVILKPSRDQEVNFKTAAPLVSEWEALSAGVKPLLAGQGKDDQDLPEEELTGRDLDFIAEETGFDRGKLRLWALAFSVGRSAAGGGAAPSIFYGWFRLGLPAEPGTLWATSTDKLVATLTDAIRQGIVPPSVAEDPVSLSEQFDQIKLDRKLQAPTQGTPAPLSSLLATLPDKLALSADQQRAVAGALANLSTNDPQLLVKIAAIPSFTGNAAVVARTLRLGALTGGNLPLTQALQSNFSDEAEGTLLPLTTLRPDEWIDLVYTHGTPTNQTITPADYAAALASTLEQQHPTASLAAHFTDGRRLALQPTLTGVGTFLKDNPGFDIVAANLNAIKDQANLDKIDDPDQLVDGLRALQRLNALGATWDETAIMVENNLPTPQHILAAGSTFLTNLLDGQIAFQRISDLYDQAVELHGVTFAAISAALSPLSGPYILPETQLGASAGGRDAVNADATGSISPVAGPSAHSVGPSAATGVSVQLEDLSAVLKSRGSQFDPGRYKAPPPVRVVNAPPGKWDPTLAHQPTLQSLFGSQDSCSCDECGSVLGPGAYFVDVMQFINNAKALDQLLARRPDLQEIELSCNNANTEVAAIDLALETLENAAALPFDVPLAPGTDIQAQLSGATVGADVLAGLKRTVRSLPGPVQATPEGGDWTVVDGHRRWKITAQFQPEIETRTSAGVTGQLDTASMNLAEAISALDAGSVAKDAESAFATLFAGNRTVAPGITNYNVTITPLAAGESWTVSYQFVAQLLLDLNRNHMTLQTPTGEAWWEASYNPRTIAALDDELNAQLIPELVRQKLASRFFGTNDLVLAQADAKSNTWTVTSPWMVQTLTFQPVRLTIASLAYQSGDPGADAIAWPENYNPEAYRKLNSATYPWSLPIDLTLKTVRLFLKRALSSREALMKAMVPVDQLLPGDRTFAIEVLGLSAAEANLISPQALPSADDIYGNWGVPAGTTAIWDAAAAKPVSGAALDILKDVSILLQQSRLSFEDMQAVIETQFVTQGGTVPLSIVPPGTCKPSEMTLTPLTAAHLDRVHRFIRLQSRLGWSTQDLDSAIQIVSPDVISDITLLGLATLLQLIELLDRPLNEILSLWKPGATATDKYLLLTSVLNLTTDEVREAEALLGVDDPLSSIVTAFDFCNRVANLQLSGIAFQDLRYLLQHQTIPGSDIYLDDSQLTEYARVAREAVRTIPDPPEIFPPLPPVDPITVAAILALRLKREDAAIASLAALLGVARELVDDLLRIRLLHPDDASKPAIAVFLEPAFINGAPSISPSATVAAILVRLYKAAYIWNALNLKTAQLSLLKASQMADTGLTALDFNTLPLAAVGAPANVSAFEQLLALVTLSAPPLRAGDLLYHYAALDFTDAAIEENAQQVIAIGLDVDSDQAKQAAKQLHLAAGQYRDPQVIVRLIQLLAALKQLGATVDQVSPQNTPQPGQANGLISGTPNDMDADTARALLRVKFGDSQWDDLIKPIADTLRLLQRDALVDYLIARDDLGDVNDLYERYLIDVQTGTCTITTRLLQATAAAQLFVQRVLLNLEPGASFSDDQRNLWDWMQSYRIWEANRRVFLFPENWLLPELRDDKTSTFSAMEGVLTQQEPSLEVTRDAVLGYLDDLGELAQINVIAMYDDRHITDAATSTEERTLYVIGRTPDQPFRYFWRSCENFGDPEMLWNGWEVLELDNANDFIMPFILAGDLHVAWPTFRKTSATTKTADPLWEVQLNWKRKNNQGWVKSKVSHDTLITTRLLGLTELRSFVFQIRKGEALIPLASNLHQQFIAIDCYTASEGQVIKTYTVDLSKVDEGPTHGIGPAGGTFGWNNVFLTISSVIYESYQLDSSSPIIYQPAKFASVTVDYVVVINEYQANQEALPLSVLLATDAEGNFSFDVPKVQNGSDVKLTFNRKNSTSSDTRTASMVDRSDPTNPQEYQNWTWNSTFVFPVDPPADTPYSPDRVVKFQQPAGTFWLVPGRDAKAVYPSNGPDIVGDADPSQTGVPQRLANGFILSAGVTSLQLPGSGTLQVDHAFGEVQIARATAPSAYASFQADEVFHLQDAAGPFYLASASNGWSVWPDGQDFVESYRDLAAVSVFGLFDPGVQATPRDVPPKLLPPPPPATGLQTTAPMITFDRTMPYAIYNWELFLHAPLAIADFLASQLRYPDARRWLHAVFDPTTRDTVDNVPQYWRFLPFRNDAQPESIATLLAWLADPHSGDPTVEQRLKFQIQEWRENPFMPHLIARLRPSAYEWYAFFAYLDVLIGWGDQLFRRDTRESVNEATLLYVLAAKLLGPRPRTITPSTTPSAQTYRSLRANSLDDFSNAWLTYADLAGTKILARKSRQVPQSAVKQTASGTTRGPVFTKRQPSESQLFTSLSGLAFCIPQNDKLAGYYDFIDQRLFNVRHCRNIEGDYRVLPLYDPPIDPLLLIKARAAGLDIESVLADLYAPLPNYRFTFTQQKALELCSEVKSLGTALLAALEKQDAEDLALLRSSQEVAMLKLVRDVRQRQVDEAAANIIALQQSQATVMERFNQYQKLLGQTTPALGQDGVPVVQQSSALAVSTDAVGEASGLGLSRKEINQFVLSAMANELTQQANTMHILSGILSIIPNVWAGEPTAGETFGGNNLGPAASAIAKAIEMGAVEASYFANQMGTFGGYERRQDEWVHQSRMALAEFKQLDKQILAANIRQDIVQHELDNHDAQTKNATAIDDFMRSKFTNQQLQRWMSTQISQVYFSTYQLALDQARRAERAYQYELGLDPSSTATFVQSDSWDNLKRGLLAGDHLHHDLKRMESAYLERNTREFEITKHISLLQLDPFAFITLKEKGSCTFQLPECLFDLDFPGHYFRRIKMVSLSIPCVAGPYASVSATLTMGGSSIRAKSSDGSYPQIENDSRFTQVLSAIKAIVTSNAQQDSGMFETSFRDERYLPFEGTGVISSWTLTLPDKFRPFDYDTISDVILHIRYTARDGGDDLKTASQGNLDKALTSVKLQSNRTGLARLFSLRHEFPTEWYRFLFVHQQGDLAVDQILTISIVKERLSFLFSQTTIDFQGIELYVKVNADFADTYTKTTLKLSLKPGTAASALPLEIDVDMPTGLLHADKTPAAGSLGSWTLTGWLDGNPHQRLDPLAIQDIFLVLRYTCSS